MRAEDNTPINRCNYPAPAREAKFLLHIAVHNGGVEKMRELIAVSDAQKKTLERLVADGHVAQFHVDRSIAFRQQVLEIFNRLVEKNGGDAST
jgi:copper(I)-binding protein